MGITLGSNFTVNTALPLDDRMVVADIAARNAIPAGRRFQGMIVHVLSDLKNYQLQGGILDGNWVDISAVTPPVVNVPFVGSSLVNTYNKALSDLGSYKTTVGTRPTGTNGSNGSPLITAAWTQTDVGTNQLTITKASGNAQGENVRFSIPVYQTNYGKVITVQFDFSVTADYVKPGSGTDGSLIMYLEYGDGVTNTYQQLSVVQIEAPTESNNLTARYRGEFQYTVDTTKSYWLMFYCPRTETTTWTAYVRNLEIRPAQYVYGTPITDWQSYTPTFTQFGTPSSVNFLWRRVGANIEIRGNFVSGTTGGSEARVSLPSGYTTLSSLPSISIAGKATRGNSSVSNIKGFDVLVEPSVTYFAFGYDEYSIDLGSLIKRIGTGVCNSGETISLYATIPIQGWSSSVQMSDQTDTRIVSFSGNKSSDQSVSANTTNVSYSSLKDTHGAWNGTDTYIVPVAGDYIVSTTTKASGSTELIAHVNGTSTARMIGTANASNWFGASNIVYNLKVGDLLTFKSTASVTITGSAGQNNISISRISGPSAIAASESVIAHYYVSAGASTTSTNPINFDTKYIDTHNAVTTGAGIWKFTAPISGTYSVAANTYYGATGAVNILHRNSVSMDILVGGAIGNTTYLSGYTTVRLLAGEFIELRPSATVTPTAQISVPAANRIQIKREGNY